MKDNKNENIHAGIAADFERKLIVIRFPGPLESIHLQPAHARDFARNLLDFASKIENNGRLVMWAVFKNPADHPGKYVGREFIGTGPCNQCIVKNTLEEVREAISIAGLVRLERMDGDVPSLVETWI